MAKDINRMSLDYIDNEIGIFILPEDVFTILDNRFHEDYVEIYTNQKEFSPETIIEYIKKYEDYIDKEKMLLLTLKNNINVRKEMNLEGENLHLYLNNIEKIRRLLDGQRISIFTHTLDNKRHKVEKIEELTAEELCTKGERLEFETDKQKQLNQKRSEAYRKIKERREKKKNLNLEKIKSIDEKIDFKNVVGSINLDDYADAFVENPEFGILLRWMIAKNSLLDNGYSTEQLDNIDLDSGLEDFMRNQPITIYMEEADKRLKEYAAYIDVDKLLLTSAYRYVKALEEKILTPGDIENIKEYFLVILSEIQNPNARMSIKRQDVDTGKIIDIKFSAKDLKIIMQNFIKPGLYLGDALIEETKKDLLEGMQKLSDVDVYLLAEIEFEEDEVVKLIQNDRENYSYIIENSSSITKEKIAYINSKLDNFDSEIIEKLLEKEFLEKEEIGQLYKDKKILPEDLIDLAEKQIMEDEELIKIYKEQEEKDESLSENLLKYFDIEKIKKYIEDEKITIEFLEFYKEILPNDEKSKQNIINSINEMLEEVNDREVSKKFYIAKIINLNDLENKIIEDDIISLYEQEKIDFSELIDLYNRNKISDSSMNLLLDVYGLSENVIEKLDMSEISIDKVMKLELDLKESYIYDRYMQNENAFESQAPAIIGIVNGNITIEQLNKLYSLGKIKEDDLFEYSMRGFFDQKIVRDIYINSLISDEKLEQLFLNGVISEKSKEFAKKSRNMGQLSKNIDKSLGMKIYDDGIEIDDKVIPPSEKLSEKIEREVNIYADERTKLPKLKKVIMPAAREEKFKSLGAKKIKRECVQYDEKSPFNDYEFYIIPTPMGEITPDCVVIAERYYKDKFNGEDELIDGNATYLFKLGDLTRISKKSKPEIISLMQQQKDKTMKRVSHSKYWSKNLDKSIEQVSGQKMKSKYTPDELSKINKINELIDGFEDYTNNNEYTRPFDEFYYEERGND